MLLETITLTLLPVPVFYLIYHRYFAFKPEYARYLQTFISGMAFALLLLLLAPSIHEILPSSGAALQGFIHAALFEKAGAFIIIFLLLRGFGDFGVMESTLAGMMFGMGFSTVENAFYASEHGASIILVRVLFSVPLHLTTCGIIGYLLGMGRLCNDRLVRRGYALRAFAYPLILHGLFDTLLISGGAPSYFVAPYIISLVMILELLLAHSQVMVPLRILRALGIFFEDWLSVYRQPRYERWIMQSMGLPGTPPVHLFTWRPGLIRFVLVFLFLSLAVVGLSFRDEILAALSLGLRQEEQVVVLGIFPMALGMIIILVGAVNPDFFRKSRIELPIILDVDLRRDAVPERPLVTYDITAANCFLRTAEPLGMGTALTLRFRSGSMASPDMRGVVVWENHANRQEATGSVIGFQTRPSGFFRFYLRYRLLRLGKGLVFNLRLPGFEKTRRLFMRPISTMQEERVLERGSVIFREGEPGREFFLLKRGKVIFYKNTAQGGIITMDIVDDGHIFGEMAILGNETRAVSAICATDCILAVADRDNITALITNNFEFALGLITNLSHRVQMSERILVENIRHLEGRNRDVALAGRALLAMALVSGGSMPDEGRVPVTFDPARIAAAFPGVDTGVLARLALYLVFGGADREMAELATPELRESMERVSGTIPFVF